MCIRDRNRRMNPNGLGIGLHTSNLLVGQLGGGKINVQSTFGQGTTFSFSIPKSQLAYVQSPSISVGEIADEDLGSSQRLIRVPKTLSTDRKVQTNTDNCSRRILIVDDNDYNLFSLERQLKTLGFSEIEIAHDGEEAISTVMSLYSSDGNNEEPKKLAMILMDIEMPIMDGAEAVSYTHLTLPTIYSV
eukprot:TRINITY_DN20446_c0_g1_i1.p1 TRINITY_DN20446_c0_g1~~TRINITY_DN20446_c0_g1_i1.p1  ORF type:complete len:209 (-),score=40.42 TRINITY_DN20446_c0_g1_i1:34-600(-)